MTAIPQMTSIWKRVGAAIADDIDDYQEEFLSEYERQQGLPPRDLPTFGTIAVRHAGLVYPEENYPACIVWIAQESAPRTDPDTGDEVADIGVGVLLVVETSDQDSTGETLHDYAAVIKQMLSSRPAAGGTANRMDRVSVDYRGVDAEGKGRTLLACDLSYLATSVAVGNRGEIFDRPPRENPYEGPLPGTPTVETTHLILNPEA